MIGIGVIGYGYWGPNLVRNFVGDGGRAGRLRQRHASPIGWSRSQRRATRALASRETSFELIDDPHVDAVADRDAGLHALRPRARAPSRPASTSSSRSR